MLQPTHVGIACNTLLMDGGKKIIKEEYKVIFGNKKTVFYLLHN